MKVLLAIGVIVAYASVNAASITWPALTDSCFVKGRPATEEDVKEGCASFVIKVGDQLAGEPLNIDIPQYALHIDASTGKETPVIIIQAEENSETGIKAVGYKEVARPVLGISRLNALKLLGTRKPD